MKLRWVLLGVGCAASAIAFSGWLPEYRLQQELAAARAEGVPTEAADIRRAMARVPDDVNAAPFILAAIEMDKTSDGKALDKASGAVVKGSGTAIQKAFLRNAFTQDPTVLARWRTAAFHPRVDFHRPWELGYNVLFPEYSDIKGGAMRLVAAAKLGFDPESNLQGAARLAALVRQEPTTISGLLGNSIGRAALNAAPDLATKKRIEATLGPPIDIRWTLLPEPSALLALMRDVTDPKAGVNSGRGNVWERLRRLGPWRTNAAWRLVHRYRELWRELPKDGTDYATAAEVLDRRMPGIYEALKDYSFEFGTMVGDPKDVARGVRSFAAFEAKRKAVRG